MTDIKNQNILSFLQTLKKNYETLMKVFNTNYL